MQDNNFYSPMSEKAKFSVRTLPFASWRVVRTIIRWVIPSIISIVIALIVLGAAFQQKVIAWVANDIMNDIAIPVKVGGVKFSLIENFPNASAILSEVVAYYPDKNSHDTLLSVKKFYLNINMLSLFKGKVQIRSIDIKNASAAYILEANGTAPHITFWKNKLQKNNDVTPFSIRGVTIKDLALRYWRKGAETKNIISIDRLTFRGDLLRDKVRGEAFISLNRCSVDNDIINQSISNHADISISGECVYGQTLSLSKISFKTPNISALGAIAIHSKKNRNDGWFQFSSNKIEPEYLQRILGLKTLNIVSLGQHRLTLNGKIVGPNLTDIQFEVNSTIDNGRFRIGNDLEIDNAGFSAIIGGSIKQNVIHPQKIDCSNLKFDLNGKTITGKFTILPQTRTLNLTSQGNITPDVLARVLMINSPKITGNNINFSAAIVSSNFLINNIILSNISMNGSIILDRVNVSLSHFNLKDITGALEIGDSLSFKNINIDGDLGQLHLDGIIPHWKQTFLSSQNRAQMEIYGKVKSPLLNLDLPSWGINQDSKNDTSTENTLGTPIKIGEIKLDFLADNIILHNLTGNNAQGTITYIPQTVFSIENASLHSFGGQIHFTLKNQPRVGGDALSIVGKIDKMDIDSLFHSFNNFDQKTITSENISGKITADFQLLGVMQNNSLLNDSLRCISNIIVENGILKHFEPLKRLAKYITLKDLETIKFQKLQNSIRIENGVITIPKMLVENNVLNLSLSGAHHLKGDFDYRLQLKLGDVLWHKKKQSSTFRPDLGIVEQKETGGGSLYLRLFGTPESYKFIYDKEMAIESLSEKLKREGSNLKKIFRSDNHPATNQQAMKKKGSNFVIKEELTDSIPRTVKDSSQITPLKKNSGFKIDWN